MSALLNCPISSEIQMVTFITPHQYYGAATQYAAPSTGMCVEAPSTHFWPPGFLISQNKLTHSVNYFFGMFRIVQDGHDHGTLCPHVEMIPAPDNLLYVVHFPFSSRKGMYCASTVKMNSEPTACLGYPLPLVMLICGDPISIPVIGPYSSLVNHFNNVTVGMTLADLLGGYIRGLFTVLVDVIIAFLTAGIANPSITPTTFVNEIVQGAGQAGTRSLAVVAQAFLTEYVEGVANDFYRSVFDATLDGDAPLTLPAPTFVVPLPAMSPTVQVERQDGSVTGVGVEVPALGSGDDTLARRVERANPPWMRDPSRVDRMFSEVF